MTTAGQMLLGGFLPSGGVGLWGILAPLGALVFLDVRRAVRWFAAFVVVFLFTGIAGEMLFPDADLPTWFTSTMLALNIIGAGSRRVRPARVLRSTAQRRPHGTPSRAGEVGSPPPERPAERDRRAAQGDHPDDR